MSLGMTVLACIAVVSVGLALYINKIADTLPTDDEILAYRANEASIVYDRKGRVITELYVENRKPMKLEQFSKWMVMSILAVSGSGNVAQYTAEKVLELGGKVLTMSDSDGYIYDPDGIDREKLDYIMELKNLYRGRIREYAEKYGCKYVEGARPWGEKADIALPSATQNELNGDDAKTLVANGVIAVSEGANMPSTPEAIKVFQDAKILYAPGKAANAGGVSVSGLEMTQNSIKLSWSAEEVDEKLKSIMKNIHEACVQYGTEADGYVNYVKGANVAGFMKVAKAMMAQGIV